MKSDFLDASGLNFNTLDEFVSYIENDVDFDDDVDGRLSIIGAVSDYESIEAFTESLEDHFEVLKPLGSVLLLSAKSNTTPYYVYLDDTFPLFFTTGTITEDLPQSIGNYITKKRNLSRLWISKYQMERLRKILVSDFSDLLMPEFTASRSPYSELPARRRPGRKRTIRYWGDDGLETYREMQHDYGVLPTNIKLEQPGLFKFVVKQKGIFTRHDGRISEPIQLIRETWEHLRKVKNVVDTSGFESVDSNLIEGHKIPHSRPWAIQLDEQLTHEDVRNFKNNIQQDDLEFSLSEWDPNRQIPRFEAEVVDDQNYGRVDLRSKSNSIRVYPHETTDFDHNIRIFNVVSDHIDPNCQPVEV